MLYKILRTFVAAALVTSPCVFAQHAPAPPPGQPSAHAPVRPIPDIKRLREHVSYLASDKLEGRRTGTPGATLAAHYIASEFHRLGLTPRGNAHNIKRNEVETREYLQRFPYVAGVELGKANAMTWMSSASTDSAQRRETLDLRLGEDWTPLGLSASARVEGAQVVFVGYGITASELNHDDYAGSHASGKAALAFEGTPDAGDPHGKFARWGAAAFKAAAARAAGAKALVLIASGENFRDEHERARLVYDPASGDAGLPVVVVSRVTAARLLGLAGAPQLSEFEKKMRAGVAAKAGDRAAQTVSHGSLNITTDVKRIDAEAYNVVGVISGSDPKLNDEYIVVGAHYDHLGRGGAGSLAARAGEIHYGADDNASGTAALLELARMLSGHRSSLRRSVVLVAFGGEEEGLLGSNYYVTHAPVPLGSTVAMLNMDMIGRLKEERLTVGGVGTAAEWRNWIERANAQFSVRLKGGVEGARGGKVGYEMPVVVGTNGEVVATASPQRFALALSEDGFGPSDHSSFYARKIPVLFFFTGTHEDYHKPSDTAERVNYDGLARILSFVNDILADVDASDPRPTYQSTGSATQGRATGFRVYLGTVPRYADSTDGMTLEGVREGSPAERAGLRAGDRIVKMAGRDVRNVYDYTQALSEMKAGEEYEVEVMRGTQRLALKITPAARK
jgi:hypothetical protein